MSFVGPFSFCGVVCCLRGYWGSCCVATEAIVRQFVSTTRLSEQRFAWLKLLKGCRNRIWDQLTWLIVNPNRNVPIHTPQPFVVLYDTAVQSYKYTKRRDYQTPDQQIWHDLVVCWTRLLKFHNLCTTTCFVWLGKVEGRSETKWNETDKWEKGGEEEKWLLGFGWEAEGKGKGKGKGKGTGDTDIPCFCRDWHLSRAVKKKSCTKSDLQEEENSRTYSKQNYVWLLKSYCFTSIKGPLILSTLFRFFSFLSVHSFILTS